MDTSVQNYDRILIQQDAHFKFHPLVSPDDLQLLVTTKANTCTRRITTYFKEIIQIENTKLEKMKQLTKFMKPHIDETVIEKQQKMILRVLKN